MLFPHHNSIEPCAADAWDMDHPDCDETPCASCRAAAADAGDDLESLYADAPAPTRAPSAHQHDGPLEWSAFGQW